MLCGYSLKDMNIVEQAKVSFVKYRNEYNSPDATDRKIIADNIIDLILGVVKIASYACKFIFSFDEDLSVDGSADTHDAASLTMQTTTKSEAGSVGGAIIATNLLMEFSSNNRPSPHEMQILESGPSSYSAWFSSIFGATVVTLQSFLSEAWYKWQGLSAFTDASRNAAIAFNEGGAVKKKIESYPDLLWSIHNKLQINTACLEQNQLESSIVGTISERLRGSRTVKATSNVFNPSDYVEDANWNKICPKELSTILPAYRIVFLFRLKLVLAIRKAREYFTDFKVIEVRGARGVGKSLMIRNMIKAYNPSLTSVPQFGSSPSSVTTFPRLYPLKVHETEENKLSPVMLLDTCYIGI